MAENFAELNDEILSETLRRASDEMKEAGSPFAWFEARGISEKAAREFGDYLSLMVVEGIMPASICLTAFVAGWCLHQGRTEKLVNTL